MISAPPSKNVAVGRKCMIAISSTQDATVEKAAAKPLRMLSAYFRMKATFKPPTA